MVPTSPRSPTAFGSHAGDAQARSEHRTRCVCVTLRRELATFGRTAATLPRGHGIAWTRTGDPADYESGFEFLHASTVVYLRTSAGASPTTSPYYRGARRSPEVVEAISGVYAGWMQSVVPGRLVLYRSALTEGAGAVAERGAEISGGNLSLAPLEHRRQVLYDRRRHSASGARQYDAGTCQGEL
jgi:hypothetical protein